MLGRSPEEVAKFLAKTTGLNKTMIGEYLGEREETCLRVMHSYVDAMDFAGSEFDTAIRSTPAFFDCMHSNTICFHIPIPFCRTKLKTEMNCVRCRTFLSGFRLPGEAQKIDRLMEKFAERFVSCNSEAFKSADVAYVLAYSVIMLNTDAHNPQVKNKMSKQVRILALCAVKAHCIVPLMDICAVSTDLLNLAFDELQDFLKNNRGINDGADLPEDYMSELYDRIINNEIKMKDADAVGLMAATAAKGGGWMDTILNLIPGRRAAASNEPSEEAIRRTHENLRSVARPITSTHQCQKRCHDISQVFCHVASPWFCEVQPRNVCSNRICDDCCGTHREKAKGATFFEATEGETVRPMLDVAWAPMLGAFSVLFEEFSEGNTGHGLQFLWNI